MTEDTLSELRRVKSDEFVESTDGVTLIIFVTSKDPDGRMPLQIPVTVVIPVIVNDVPPDPTAVTLL